MSDIHINRGGQNLGTFSEADVQSGLSTGKYLGTDLAWRTGMENWKPLSQWAQFTVPVELMQPILPSAGFVPDLLEDKSLPSWEQKNSLGFFPAFGATVKEVLVEPTATFSRMKETGGFLVPFLYMLIATGVGTVLAMGLQFGLRGVLGSALGSQNAEVAKLMAMQGMGAGSAIIGVLIALPIVLFIMSFITTAFWHLGLMILGGVSKPFEATYRVYCYTAGSAALIGLVPCCGGIASLVWTIVSGGIGLAQVHGTSTTKGVFAILLPLLLCCGLCGVGVYFFANAMSGNPEVMNALKSFQHR